MSSLARPVSKGRPPCAWGATFCRPNLCRCALTGAILWVGLWAGAGGTSGLEPARAWAVPKAGQVPTVAVLSPDARWVAAQYGQQVAVWDRVQGRQVVTLVDRAFFRGALGHQTLAAVTPQGMQVWWGPKLGRTVRLQGAPSHRVVRTVVSANGARVAAIYPQKSVAHPPDTVAIWDARSGRRRAEIVPFAKKKGETPEKSRVLGAAFCAKGRLLAVFGDRQRQGALLALYRLTRRGVQKLWEWSSPSLPTAYSVALEPRGRVLVLGAGDKLLFWSLRPARTIASKTAPAGKKATGSDSPKPASVAAVSSAPDFAVPTSRVVRFFPAELQKVAERFPPAHALAFSADGKQLGVVHSLGVVGVGVWRLTLKRGALAEPPQPHAWVRRPRTGGPLRGVSWDTDNHLWGISSTQAPTVQILRAQGDRLVPQGEWTLGLKERSTKSPQ